MTADIRYQKWSVNTWAGLQAALAAAALTGTVLRQLADWWLDTAYLEYRSPVTVWSSPGLVMPLQEWDTQQQQLKYAARLISDALRFKQLVDG